MEAMAPQLSLEREARSEGMIITCMWRVGGQEEVRPGRTSEVKGQTLGSFPSAEGARLGAVGGNRAYEDTVGKWAVGRAEQWTVGRVAEGRSGTLWVSLLPVDGGSDFPKTEVLGG